MDDFQTTFALITSNCFIIPLSKNPYHCAKLRMCIGNTFVLIDKAKYVNIHTCQATHPRAP